MNPAHATPPANVLDEALQLAALGWRVLPIKPGQKHPPMTAWQDAATSDPHIITNWFGNLYRNHGLGVATGQLPNGLYLFVLDVDEHDPAASGSDTLHTLETTHGELPDTVEVLTGSGGRHIYLTSPTAVHNDAGRRLGPGLDIRGVGGQVLAPPTIHPNGTSYTWLADHGPEDIDVAPAPTWLLERLTPIEPAQPKAKQRFERYDFDDDGPAARFNAAITWGELLTADGWKHTRTDRNGEEHWTRPGKQPRDGTSATVFYEGRDVLVVFTSSIPWLAAGAYSRFGYYACRHHNGDRSAAASALLKKRGGPSPVDHHQAVDPQEPWPQPIPLTEEKQPPPFPLHTLPTWIVEHAIDVAEDLQVAVDLPATLGLGALAVAALGNAKVTYQRQRWTQPLNLYCAIALPPSAGKSPAKAAMFAALEQLELRRMTAAAPARAKADTERSLLEKRRRNLEEKAAKATGEDARAAKHELFDLVDEMFQMPRIPSGRLLADDATTEALGVVLADAGGNIAVVSAEGGIFDRIAGMYSDTANLDLYLEGWSGGRYSVDRIKREAIHINEANLCVITTVQPSVLDEIGARKQFAGRGLTARFLLCKPASNVGNRNRLKQSEANETTRNNYDTQIVNLADLIAANPVTLEISGGASDLFAHWDQALETKLRPGADLEHLGEWIGKVRANVLRIAALLHLADNQHNDTINADTMQRAIELGDYYTAHMQTIAAGWGSDERTAKAKKVLDWITRNGILQFSARDIMRNMRRIFTETADLAPAVQLLTECGWIRPQFDGPFLTHTSRGKPSPTFAVHPDANRLANTVATQHTPSVSRVSPDQPAQKESVSRVSPVSPVKNRPKTVSVSRVSRVSPKGRKTSPSSSLTETTPIPPTPGDTRDTRDTLHTPNDLNMFDIDTPDLEKEKEGMF
jgi:replicative DNA helicase